MKQYDYIIAGSGLFAGVFAYAAKQHGKTCLVLEKRDHIGGNIYCEDVEGIHVVFQGMVQHAVEVALSHSREDFRTIYNSGERPAVTDVSLDNLGQQARFIRVRFPGETTPICKIEVFA